MSPVRRTGCAALAALALTLAGCASETEQYCDALADRKDALTELAASSEEGSLEDTLEVLRELRDEAPGDIADEWSTLVFAVEALVDAFDEAGTTAAEYDPATPPDGVSEAEAQRIEGAAAELRSVRVLRAAESLEQHARDVCKVDLGLGSGSG